MFASKYSGPESKTSSTDTTSASSSPFYTNIFPRPNNIPPNHFQATVEASREKIQTNPFDHWKESDGTSCLPCIHEQMQAWNINKCAGCHKFLCPGGPLHGIPEGVNPEFVQPLRPKLYRTELEWKEKILKEDQDYGDSNARGIRSHASGIRLDALIAIAYDHDCWDWKTWRVVRDIIQPATKKNRCRFYELDEMKDFTGPADVFMSHCWTGTFGDMIGAASHGGKMNRYIWNDIFAVRQWPGNDADIDFRSVIQRCKAVIVSFPVVDGLKDKFMGAKKDRDAFLTTPEGIAATTTIPTFRLWCIVEIAAAVNMKIPIVVKCGKIKKRNDDNIYIYDTEGGNGMMDNLQYMVNAEESKCAVEADFEREMNLVKLMDGGVDGVNKTVACVVVGAVASINTNILEIDAAVCGEMESLLNLKMNSLSVGEEWMLAIKVLMAFCDCRQLDRLVRRWKHLPLVFWTLILRYQSGS